MKLFLSRQIREALSHSREGGQALHCHQFIGDWAKAPACFKKEVRAGRDIAHLFDLDAERLVATARRLGVRVILIEKQGEPAQHIDLCAGPLRKAKAECE